MNAKCQGFRGILTERGWVDVYWWVVACLDDSHQPIPRRFSMIT